MKINLRSAGFIFSLVVPLLFSACRCPAGAGAAVSDPLQAVRRGDAAAVQAWLRNEPDVQLHGEALRIASARGDEKSLTALLNAGTDPEAADASGHTPLTRACMAGQIRTAELLLGAGARPGLPREPGVTPLLIAAVNGFTDLAELLLARGANVRDLDLNYTVRWGDTRTALTFLQKGADPSVRPLPAPAALVTACRRDDRALIAALLDRSSDPNLRDESGETLLSIACGAGNLPLAQLLIDRGADPNQKDRDGSFPLIRAAQTGKPALVLFLLDQGADVNMTDSNRATAAFGAALQDDAEILRLLAEHGADFSVASAWGTPEEYAAKERKGRATAFFETLRTR